MGTFTDLIRDGLTRKAAIVPSIWSQTYRIMSDGKSYGYKYHPWAREMMDCDAEEMVGMKGAQLGFTEVALNKAFYAIDVKGWSVLYVLPASKPDAANFSSSRFDPALELSPHLKNLFSDVKNVGHKRAGSANLFIVGSRSKSQLKSNPTALTIADELEEMVQENISLIPERMAGQAEKQFFKLSTPFLPDKGISGEFNRSTQELFVFKCPSCRRATTLDFPDCLEITADDPNDPEILKSRILCKECKATLPHETKWQWLAEGKWVANNRSLVRGFHVNQLYSSTMKPYEVARKYLLGLRDPAEQQEFWNSKMGMPFEVQGARVSDQELEDAKGGYMSANSRRPNSFVTIGIDVGKKLHYEVTEYIIQRGGGVDVNVLANARVLAADTKDHFHEIDQLIMQWRPRCVVIDVEPERRASMELCARFPNLVYMARYTEGVAGIQVNVPASGTFNVHVDRTAWLDLSLGRFHNGSIKLPLDISREYREHIQTLVRVYKKDKHGQERGLYKKGEHEPDHFAHARNYSEVALKLGLRLAHNGDISGIF